MKTKIKYIFILLGTPFVLIAQSVTDSFLLPEINIFETKLEKHSVGVRTEEIKPATLNLTINESFADVLQNNSTIFVKSYGALSTASFRGTAACHTLFVWNGVPINAPTAAQMDLRLIPVNTFDKMSIAYGGNSAVFGSGSVGGSIHLDNNAIYNVRDSISLDFEKGSFNKDAYSIALFTATQQLSFSSSYSSVYDENKFPYTYYGAEKLNEHALVLGKNITTNISAKLDNQSELKLHYWKSDFWREIPGNITAPNSTAEQKDISDRYLLSVNKKYDRLNIAFKEAIMYDNLYYDDDPKNIHSYSESKMLISEFDLGYKIKQIFMNLSLLHQQNDAHNSSYIGLNKKEYSSSIFSAISYRTDFIASEISVRNEVNSEYKVPLIPSFSTEIRLRNWKIRTRVNKNFRAPTFNDRYWIGFGANGNPNLLPESGINKEIGVDVKMNNFNHHFTYYLLHVNDWILWKQQDNGNWMPENLKEVKSKGIEWKSVFTYKLRSIHFYQELNYQYNLAKNLKGINYLDASVGKQLIYTPKHKGNFTTVVSYKHLCVKLNHSFVSSVFTSSDNINSLPSYYIMNGAVNFILPKLKSKIGFIVNNLGNTTYQSYQNYPNPGREFLFTINFY